MEPQDSLKTQQQKLQAYGRARPIVESHRNDPFTLEMFGEVALEFLAEGKHYVEVAHLLQTGLSHVALGLQQLTELPPGPEPCQERRLVIAWCPARQSCPCGVCGRPDHAEEVGPALYLEGSAETACAKCAETLAPELLELLRVLQRNPKFVSVIEALRQEHLKKAKRDF